MASPAEPARYPYRNQDWVVLLFLFICGLALRLWFVRHTLRLTGDTVVYGGIARNWLEHGVYSFSREPSPVRPTLIRLPGYPLFLAICFRVFGVENYRAVMMVQVYADLVSCALVAATARRVFGRRAGILGFGLACLCPFTASYTAQCLTETLTLLCIAGAFFFFLHWLESGGGWIVPLSLTLGYAILLRPEQGLLAGAVLPAILWRRPFRIAPILLSGLMVIAPLVPWTVRNYRTFGVFQPLAPRSASDPGELIPSGFQRWYRTWAVDFASTEDVYWNYDGNPIALADLPARAFDSAKQYAVTAALLEEYNETSNATAELDARFDAIARERIQAHPFRYFLRLPAARVANMLLRPRTENTPWPTHWWRFHEHRRESTFALAYAVLNCMYYVLAALGFRRWIQNPGRENRLVAYAMLGFVGLRLALLLTLDNSEPRYTLEFFPILIFFASARFTASTGSGIASINERSTFRRVFRRSRIL